MANGFINKSLPDTDEMSLACLFGRGFKTLFIVMLMVVDMVMMTTYYIDNDQDHHEDIRAYYILSLPGFGSSCTNTWTDLCPSDPTDEWTRQRF